MKKPWIIILLALSACEKAETVEVEVPAEVEYVAALELSGPVVVYGSEVVAWPKGQGLPLLAGSEAETIVVGFSAAELREAGALDAAGTVVRGRVRSALGCEPRLPRALWAARLVGSGALEPVDAAMIPELSTDGLADSCSELTSVSVDIDCVDLPCEAIRIEEVGACGLSLDLSACGQGVVSAHRQPGGAICVERSEAEQQQCAIYASEPAAAPFEIVRQKILPAASATMPEFLRFNELLLPDFLFFGWAYDFALVGDRIWVALGDGTARDVCRGGADLSTRLMILDFETLEIVSTATVPPCLTRLVSQADGALAVFAEQGRWTLGRLDARAQVTARAALTATVGVHRLVDMELLPEANGVAVLFNLAAEDGKTGDGGNILTVHALDDLRELRHSYWPRGQRWAMAAAGAKLLAIADHHERRIEWWDVETGTAAPALVLPRRDGFVYDDSLLDVVALDGELAVHATRDPLLMLVEAQGALSEKDYFYERKLDPVTSATWPSGQLLVAATGTNGSEHQAWVARYDLAQRRFLPGAHLAGEGLISKMLPGPGGRVVALLPWAGELVRFDPR